VSQLKTQIEIDPLTESCLKHIREIVNGELPRDLDLAGALAIINQFRVAVNGLGEFIIGQAQALTVLKAFIERLKLELEDRKLH
jgi:hypothetical protein